MNVKTTLVLLILLAIAIPAAIILPKHIKTTEEAKLAKDKVFPDLKTRNAQRMEIKKDGLHIVCEKTDDTWHIVEPLKDRADLAKVEGVLSACEFMRHKGTVTGELADDQKKYGLDKPQAEVTVADKKDTWTLLIGKAFESIDEKSASGRDIYVKIKGSDTVYRVDADILKDIKHEVVHFRYRYPFEVLSYRVNKIELANEAGSVVLAKEDDQWRLQKPVEDKVDSAKVTDLISSAGSAEKQDFTADNVEDFAQYGLDVPAVSIKFRSDKEEGAKTLLIGKAVEAAEGEKPDKVYARVEGGSSVFTLKDEIVEKLSPKANDLRDTTLLTLEADDVTEVEIKRPETTIALKKDGWDWKMTQPMEVGADANAVKDFVNLIDEAKIVDWVDEPGDLAAYGLDKPTTITLKQKKGDAEDEEKEEEAVQLLVGKKDGEECYASLPGKPAVLKITGKIADEAARDYLAFRSKRMLSFSRWRSQKLNIINTGGAVFAAEKTGEGKWSISKPVAGKADMANVNNILWDLSSLDAEKVVAEKAADLAPYGLDKPRITATITVIADEEDKEDETHTVLIGSESEDANYAKVEGRDIVFTVRNAVVSHLAGNLLSRNVMDFEEDDATALIVVSGDKSFACERKDKDSDWQITKPEGSKIDDKKIRGVIKGMHLLRAARYVEYAPGDPAKYGLDKPAATITVEVKDDQDRVLQIGKKLEAGTVYARTAAATPVFILEKQNAQQVDRVLADFLDGKDDKPEDK